jgi:hypothetical protein
VAVSFRAWLWPLALAALAAVLFTTRFSREMADFEVYQRAAARAAGAEPLYRASDGHYQFKYLPAFALAMRPFAGLDPATAKAIWFGVSIGFLGMLLRWSARGLPERRRTERALLWITFLLMAKFYAHELTLGQSNLLLGALLVGALLAVQIDQPIAAGVLVGLAAFVKPYALIVAPWLAVTYGLMPLTWCGGVILAGLAAPALVYGWTGNLSLLSAWWQAVSTTTPANLLGADNISVAAMWAKWIGAGSEATSLTLIIALALLIVAGVVWADRSRLASPEYLEVALLMLLVPLLSPQGWDYVLLLATPAVMLIVDRWGDLDRAWQAVAGASLALMCLTIFDLMGRALYGRFMALSVVSVAAIGVALVLARLRWMRLA